MDNKNTEQNVKQLNSFLRGEIAAVETYNQAIEKVEAAPVRMTLAEVRDSHNERVLKLTKKIQQLGGVPEKKSGIWGTFAKAVEGTAKIAGVGPAISALEEGEDHGLNDYKGDLSELSSDVQHFIVSEVLPAQRKTHDIMSRLQDSV